MATSLSAVLLINPPREERPDPQKRATRVYHRLPTWLTCALNDSYHAEVAHHFGRRLRNLYEAGDFLRVLEREFGCKVFDHCGSDGDGNFVAEPFAATCATCHAAAARFAQRLGVRFEVSALTFHAPGSDKAVRFTFRKPEMAP
jgi:hypothetical protein